MKLSNRIAAALSAAAIFASASPPAHATPGDDAEKVRRLDIMLMVSALRCRNTADGFQEDYNRFSAAHLGELNASASTLKKTLEARFGATAAKRELDKMSVSMANSYGQGHPWLNCHDLKEATQGLAGNRAPGALLSAADALLGDSGRSSLVAGY